MAIITSTYGTSSVSKLHRDTDADNTVEHNINSGAGNIQQIFINNSANAATAFYLFMWNVTSGVTFGVTKPQMVLYCPAGASKHYIFPRNLVFGTGISIGGSTNFAASTFTEVNPAASVAIAMFISA